MTTAAPLRPRRALAVVRLVVRYQLLARRSSLLIAIFPVLLLWVFADHPVDRRVHVGHGNVVALVVAHLASYVTITAMTAVGSAVAEDRARGWLRTLRTLGVAPLRCYATARALGAVVLAALGLVALEGVGILGLGAHLSPANWLLVNGVCLAGATIFAMGALAIGTFASPTSAAQLAAVAALILEFAGGVFVPLSSLPHTIALVGSDTPAAAILAIALAPFYGAHDLVHAGVVLVGWGVAFTLAAALGYHRTRSERAR